MKQLDEDELAKIIFDARSTSQYKLDVIKAIDADMSEEQEKLGEAILSRYFTTDEEMAVLELE